LSDFIVRPATREDFPAIRSLIRMVRINPIGLDWRRFIIVVTPEGNLIGCGQIKCHHDGSQEVASIAVQEQFRGRGMARRIIESLLSSNNDRPIYLMCRARLKDFYLKFGFRPVNIEQMPPYFRRISHLENIVNHNKQPGGRLLVMCLN
jgi:N-acetylglutamate synthase-like GNAT family acetyltransferase